LVKCFIVDIISFFDADLFTFLHKGNTSLDNVKMVVVDEADLILSYGYSKE
jgi:superfamily II DNA/RNA helicase